jgi:anti-sigma factor RsiW
MNCREFKSNHVGFVDDILPAADMAEMRRHIATCPSCSTLDIRIRRSLLVVRNLPQIEPSADFFARLSEALRESPPVEPRRAPYARAATFAAATAALAAAAYFAMAVLPGDREPVQSPASMASTAAIQPVAMNEVAMAAAIPAGVPVWPAMFMVGELPTHFVNAELLETSLGR